MTSTMGADEPAAKKAKLSELGDDPFEVRKQIFKCGGLRVPNESYSGPQKWTLVAPGFGDFVDAPPLELQYFAIRGLGQMPQLILEAAGYPYSYTVMTSPYFREHVKSQMRFGRMPYLRAPDGTELVQSKAIVRYAAKLCGLAGKSDTEAARCDMLHEMSQTEAKVDASIVPTLQPDAVRNILKEMPDMKSIGRVQLSSMADMEKTVASLKFWDECVRCSKSGWLLGGLGDGYSDFLCYVDLSLYWLLRPHAAKVEACGFTHITTFLRQVGGLPGIIRLFKSGRLMPDMQEGYVYAGDDLVPEPAS